MKKYLFIALALMSVACDRYQEFDAYIEGHNPTKDVVTMYVGTSNKVTLNPHSNDMVTYTVMIPKRGDIADLDDRQTRVSVNFRNHRTGKLTEPEMCRAGAKVITIAIYEVDDREADGGDVDCRSAW